MKQKLDLLKKVKDIIFDVPGEFGNKIRVKYQQLENKNPNLETIKRISQVLNGEKVVLFLKNELIPLFQYCELTISQLKELFLT